MHKRTILSGACHRHLTNPASGNGSLGEEYRPTNAVSAIVIKGSIASEIRAGTARLRICSDILLLMLLLLLLLLITEEDDEEQSNALSLSSTSKVGDDDSPHASYSSLYAFAGMTRPR